MKDKHQALQTILDKAIDNKKIFGTSFALKSNRFSWIGSSGNLSTEQPYFIASTTKLFTTALILKLRSQGKLELNEKIEKYFAPSQLKGLHLYRGKDYTFELTIQHLLAHTSGLPDYFQGKGDHKTSIEDEIKNGNDQSWNWENVMEWTKAMKSLFPPGTKNKANYSDTNFQLLGSIIETITERTYSEISQDWILRPLGLSKTYLYKDPQDKKPKPLYYKNKELHIPLAMTSFGCDGGMVSTSQDMLVFIEAFFQGKLFPSVYIHELQVWNRIFFPMQSGIGIHLFKLPWIFNPVGAIPSFIGHSGLSGALAYYCPFLNLYIAGTVNQVAYPDSSFRLMIQLARAARL